MKKIFGAQILAKGAKIGPETSFLSFSHICLLVFLEIVIQC